MTPFEHLIMTYGYLALFLGTLAEGETIAILAGFLAHRGYLYLPFVWIVSFAGSFANDQIIFHIGRAKGASLLKKHPSWKEAVKRPIDLLERYQNLIILGFRFMYGFRTITPFALGYSKVSATKFLILNLISAAVWAVVICSLGYLFGTAIEAIFGRIKHVEEAIFFGFVIAVAFVIVMRLIHRKVAARSQKPPD